MTTTTSKPSRNATEITTAMVLEYVLVAPVTAAKMAIYANHRLSGLLPVDARRETGKDGIGETTGHRYEKALRILCDRLGLPTPRDTATSSSNPPDFGTTGAAGRHERHHVQRGVSSATCPHGIQATPHASKWCPLTCDRCSARCGLLANHGSGHRCRSHFS